jgi:hypothetical protein
MWANRSRRLAPPAVGIAEPAPGARRRRPRPLATTGRTWCAKPEEAAPADTAADPPGRPGVGRAGRFAGLRRHAGPGRHGRACHPRVALHVGFSVRDRTGPYLSRLDVGVAVFFALSGFLLYRPFVARRMDGRPRPPTRDYLRNRFLRIFPGYWLALTILAWCSTCGAGPDIQSFGDFVRYYGPAPELLRTPPRWAGSSRRGRSPTRSPSTSCCRCGRWAPPGCSGGSGPPGGAWPSWRCWRRRRPGPLTLVYQVHSFGNDDVTTGPSTPAPLAAGQLPPVRRPAWRWRLLEWSPGAASGRCALLEWPGRHPLVCWAGGGRLLPGPCRPARPRLPRSGRPRRARRSEGGALRGGGLPARLARRARGCDASPDRCAGWAADRWVCWGCCRTASTSGTRG